MVFSAVVHNRSGFGAKRLFFGLHAPKYVQKIRGDVVRVRLQIRPPLAHHTVVFARGTPLRLPDSRDIRLAVQAGCGSSQVRLAVFRTRDARVRIVRPLRISTREGSGKSDSHERDEDSSMKHQFTYSGSTTHRSVMSLTLTPCEPLTYLYRRSNPFIPLNYSSGGRT